MPQELPKPELVLPDAIILNDGEKIILRNNFRDPQADTYEELEQILRKSARAPIMLMGGLAVGSQLYMANFSEMSTVTEIAIGTLWTVGPAVGWFGRRFSRRLSEFHGETKRSA